MRCRASMRVSVPGERSASWSRGGEGANTSWTLLCLGLHLCQLIATLITTVLHKITSQFQEHQLGSNYLDPRLLSKADLCYGEGNLTAQFLPPPPPPRPPVTLCWLGEHR